jgi:hypothetical protein
MSDVTLNPPERKQRLSDERIAEIGQAAAAMPHDVPVAGWLGDLCADLLDARAQRDETCEWMRVLEEALRHILSVAEEQAYLWVANRARFALAKKP